MIPLGQMPIAVSGNQVPAGANSSQRMLVESSVFNQASLILEGATVDGVKRISVSRTRYPDVYETCQGPPGGLGYDTNNQLWFVNGTPWTAGTHTPPAASSFGPLYMRATGVNAAGFTLANISNGVWTNASRPRATPMIDITYYLDGIGSAVVYLDLTYDSTGTVYERHEIVFVNRA